MDKIVLNAYAKINLFLEVCEKRADSYHNIDSIMQTVSLCDVVTLEKNECIALSNDAGLPNNENNLAYKAAALFFNNTGIKGGAKIHIEKKIPISAGLAGGSTNAAAVLRGLDILYETRIDTETLCGWGAKLGADVPFCIKQGTFITRGIGDKFIPCAPLPHCYLVISKIGEGVSTPYAYGEIDRARDNINTVYKSSKDVSEALARKNIADVCNTMYNVFESVVCPIRPRIAEQKEILLKNKALNTMMSGSGPSVFGIFDNCNNAENALKQLRDYGAAAFLCTPINND